MFLTMLSVLLYSFVCASRYHIENKIKGVIIRFVFYWSSSLIPLKILLRSRYIVLVAIFDYSKTLGRRQDHPRSIRWFNWPNWKVWCYLSTPWAKSSTQMAWSSINNNNWWISLTHSFGLIPKAKTSPDS